MVNKVIITPTEVRGQGNIISPPHNVNDYIRYLSSVTETDGVFTVAYEPYSLNFSVSEDEINYGESIVLSCSVSGTGASFEGETVTFYNGSLSIGTGTVSSGVATLTVSNLVAGEHQLKAVYDGTDSNIVSVTVYKVTPTLSLSADETLIDSGDTVTLTGALSVGSGASVKIMNNGVLVDTVTTGSGGAFTKTVTLSSYGVLQAVFDGNTNYTNVSSSIVQVYVMGDDYVELSLTGSELTQDDVSWGVGGTGIVIDYGDGTIETSNGEYGHTYASSGNYTVKMYNVNSLLQGTFGFCESLTGIIIPDSVTTIGDTAFYACENLTSITIPDTVTNIERAAFYACLSLTNITIPDSVTSMGEYVFGVDYALTDVYLEWDTSTEIVQYDSTWIFDTNSGLKFHIPYGTTSLYTAKGYPSDKLVEESPAPSVDSLTLVKSAGKQVLSYADKTSGSGNAEFCTLTATALDSNSQGVSGQSVVFKNGDTTLDTVTTDSNGEASYTYVSQGVGDVSIKAECSSLIQTYSIEDCYKYDSSEHSQSFNTSTTSQEVISGFSWDNTHDWECTYDFKASTNGKRIDIVPPLESLNHHLGFGNNAEGYCRVYVGKASSGEDGYNVGRFTTNTYYTVIIKKIGSNVTFKLNDTVLNTYAATWLSNYQSEGLKYTSWTSTGTIYIKNIKIKPL